MPEIIKQPKALDDLDGIYDHIAVEHHNPDAADRFMDELQRKMESHSRQPLMGDLREDLGEGIRSFPFKKNYVVIYRPLEDGIDVLRVFHSARNYPRLFRNG